MSTSNHFITASEDPNSSSSDEEQNSTFEKPVKQSNMSIVSNSDNALQNTTSNVLNSDKPDQERNNLVSTNLDQPVHKSNLSVSSHLENPVQQRQSNILSVLTLDEQILKSTISILSEKMNEEKEGVNEEMKKAISLQSERSSPSAVSLSRLESAIEAIESKLEVIQELLQSQNSSQKLQSDGEESPTRRELSDTSHQENLEENFTSRRTSDQSDDEQSLKRRTKSNRTVSKVSKGQSSPTRASYLTYQAFQSDGEQSPGSKKSSKGTKSEELKDQQTPKRISYQSNASELKEQNALGGVSGMEFDSEESVGYETEKASISFYDSRRSSKETKRESSQVDKNSQTQKENLPSDSSRAKETKRRSKSSHGSHTVEERLSRASYYRANANTPEIKERHKTRALKDDSKDSVNRWLETDMSSVSKVKSKATAKDSGRTVAQSKRSSNMEEQRPSRAYKDSYRTEAVQSELRARLLEIDCSEIQRSTNQIDSSNQHVCLDENFQNSRCKICYIAIALFLTIMLFIFFLYL